MLLRGDGHRGGGVGTGDAGLGAGGVERRLPVPRLLLAARRGGGRVAGAAGRPRWPRCRGRGPGPCRPTWTSRPRPRGALAGPEEQFGDELVQPLVAVALRRQRLLVVGRTTGSRRGRRPGWSARRARPPWRFAAPPGSRRPRGSGAPSRPGSGRSACSRGRSPTRLRRPRSGRGGRRSAACPPIRASSSSLTM